MPTSCLDTNIIIWAIKEEAKAGQDDMIPRCKQLVKHLRGKNHTLVVPAIVLAEALVRVPANDHPGFIRKIRTGFVIAPFDPAAAGRLAQIWAAYKDHPHVREAAANQERTRAMMKADCQIIATALAAGATALYTNNTRDFERFRMPGLEIKEIPPLEQKSELVQEQLL